MAIRYYRYKVNLYMALKQLSGSIHPITSMLPFEK